MTNLIKHKRVEFSELFYDLVFVFAISKATALIHHLHNGILTWKSLFDFFMSLLVLVNSWMIQTVYTNRYGKNSLFNMVIMFINMGLLLFISNMIGHDWQVYFHSFCLAVGTLTLTLFFQYQRASLDDRLAHIWCLSSSSPSNQPWYLCLRSQYPLDLYYTHYHVS